MRSGRPVSRYPLKAGLCFHLVKNLKLKPLELVISVNREPTKYQPNNEIIIIFEESRYIGQFSMPIYIFFFRHGIVMVMWLEHVAWTECFGSEATFCRNNHGIQFIENVKIHRANDDKQPYYTLLKPKRHSLRCHDFVVQALLLRMHTNVVDFRVMRRLCHRE